MDALRRARGLSRALATFVELRRTPTRFASREAFLAWQRAKLSAWLRAVPQRVRAYADRTAFAGQLQDFPIVDKAAVMADFGAFNSAGLTAEEGWRAMASGGRWGP